MADSTTTAGWAIDILVEGYPGKSVCHGALGWSTIVLLRGHGRVALVDVGSFAQRQPLIDRLAAHGLAPAAVTDVLLTHSHWDHSINWVLFPAARVVIGDEELAWSLAQPWGATPVPELYMRELAAAGRTERVAPGAEVLPGITAHAAPGHTPGHLFFHLRGEPHDVLFTGDAAKNRAELLSLTADMTYDPQVSRRSMEAIWRLWRARPDTLLVPGHDVPMRLVDGEPAYLGPRRAALTAWFGRTLEQTSLFELTLV